MEKSLKSRPYVIRRSRKGKFQVAKMGPAGYPELWRSRWIKTIKEAYEIIISDVKSTLVMFSIDQHSHCKFEMDRAVESAMIVDVYSQTGNKPYIADGGMSDNGKEFNEIDIEKINRWNLRDPDQPDHDFYTKEGPI